MTTDTIKEIKQEDVKDFTVFNPVNPTDIKYNKLFITIPLNLKETLPESRTSLFVDDKSFDLVITNIRGTVAPEKQPKLIFLNMWDPKNPNLLIFSHSIDLQPTITKQIYTEIFGKDTVIVHKRESYNSPETKKTY